MDSHNPNSWLAESLRFTIFPLPDSSIDSALAKDWWEQLMDTPPESTTIKSKEGITQSFGPVGDGEAQLLVDIHPDRVDWRLFPRIEHAETESAPPFQQTPNIGQFERVLPEFIELMTKWVNRTTLDISRLALGVVLLLPIEDRISGYRQLAKYLPAVKIDPENSSDFSYSINRPRTSTNEIEGLKINRLSRWSVSAFKAFRIPNLSSGQSQLKTVFLSNEAYICRVELDINTNYARAEALPRERLIPIIAELAALATEISHGGDLP